MKKYLITLFLVLHVSLSADSISAIEIYESNTDISLYHIAIYSDGSLYIITDLEGPNKGLQEIYHKGELISSSKDIHQGKNIFFHFYPNLVVYSTDEKQSIEFRKRSKDKTCSVLSKIKKKS